MEPLTPQLRRELRSHPVLLREVVAELPDPALMTVAFEALGVDLATTSRPSCWDARWCSSGARTLLRGYWTPR